MLTKNNNAKAIATLLMAVAGCMNSAEAVHLNPAGTGQVLVYPYFNALENYVTNVNLVNSTDQTKAVRIRFRDSQKSRDMFDFNIYLSPHDVWTGTLRQSTEPDQYGNFVGTLTTRDRSCTLPVQMAATCADSKCETSKNFHGYEVYGIQPEDTQEGYIEVIEMGVVTDADVQASVVHDNDEPKDCSALERKFWAKNGVFTKGQGLAPPTGGLFGHTAVLNVATGVAFAIDPVAIDDYSTSVWANTVIPDYTNIYTGDKVPQHTRPDDANLFDIPSLATGSVASSEVLVKNPAGETEMLVTQWKAFEKDVCLEDDDSLTPACGVNPYPIAHSLAAQSVMNEYFLDPSNDWDGHTDWVMTFPMKKHGIAWEDPTATGLKPEPLTVSTMDKVHDTQVRAQIDGLFNREERCLIATDPSCSTDAGEFLFSPVILPKLCDEEDKVDGVCPPPPCDKSGTCTSLPREVNVVSFTSDDGSYDDTRTVLSSESKQTLTVGEFVSGWARLSFPGYDLSAGYADASAFGMSHPTVPTKPLADSRFYQGVPVIGAAFIDGKSAPGSMEYFGDALPHKYQMY